MAVPTPDKSANYYSALGHLSLASRRSAERETSAHIPCGHWNPDTRAAFKMLLHAASRISAIHGWARPALVQCVLGLAASPPLPDL